MFLLRTLSNFTIGVFENLLYIFQSRMRFNKFCDEIYIFSIVIEIDFSLEQDI